MHYVKCLAASVAVLIVYAVVVHYVGKFCGFNQLPKEGETEYD